MFQVVLATFLLKLGSQIFKSICAPDLIYEHRHQFTFSVEVEEGQILSFTRGQVTVWNAVQKTTESSFTLDKAKDVSFTIT